MTNSATYTTYLRKEHNEQEHNSCVRLTFDCVDAVHEDAHVLVAGHFAFVEESPGRDDVLSSVAEFLVGHEFRLGSSVATQRPESFRVKSVTFPILTLF